MRELIKKQLEINRIAITMELDDEEEDEFVLMHLRRRKPTHEMYNSRITEGAFRTMFDQYLSNDEILFRKYLRLPPQMFYDLLSCIESDIKNDPCHRHAEPISPTQQLCLTLRLDWNKIEYFV